MRTLAIETAGAACSIALMDGTEVVAERHEIVGRGHAERLIPWIAALPDGGRADRIIVGCGPGSFTGVRIGVAAARGLGLGWGVPVFGVSSLLLIASACDAPVFSVAVEGGHGELFVQKFTQSPLGAEGSVQSLLPQAAAMACQPIIVGNGAPKIVALRGTGEAREGHARAACALQLDPRHLSSDVKPIYGRGADAKPMA